MIAKMRDAIGDTAGLFLPLCNASVRVENCGEKRTDDAGFPLYAKDSNAAPMCLVEERRRVCRVGR